MKKLLFNELLSLSIDWEKVAVNGVKFIYQDNVLKEKLEKELPFMDVKSITDKYELKDWQIQPEDAEDYMKEIDELKAEHTEYNEIALYIDKKNVLEYIKELESL